MGASHAVASGAVAAATTLSEPLSTAVALGVLLRAPHAHEAERERVLGKCAALLHRLVWFDRHTNTHTHTLTATLSHTHTKIDT